MAYEPTIWECGDMVTATKMNNLEAGVQEALAKECDCGYECVIERTILFEGSLTTEDMGGAYGAQIVLSALPTADTIIITIDGTEYVLPLTELGGAPCYGEVSNDAPSFANYPCFFAPISESIGVFATENAGTYSVMIEVNAEVITTTECFGKAVNSVVPLLKHLLDGEADGSLRSNTSLSESSNYSLGAGAVALGDSTKASGASSFAEGELTEATGNHSHAEGYHTIASARRSHAEGYATEASVDDAHAEGYVTKASGNSAHTEGSNTKASGSSAHAEGGSTTASGSSAHAEGGSTTASGGDSHAEGSSTKASGESSHAEGRNTTASGKYSHAEGYYTTANHRSQHTFGEWNVLDPSSAVATDKGNYIEIVGNGTSTSARSNARTLDWSGNETIAGTLTQSSDKRLKEHIEYLGDDAIEFVRALRPAHYIKDNAHHTGFYAQDVEEIDKWDCMTGEMNGYMTLGYIELIAPLVAYCHSLEERIAVLEGR